MDTLYTKTSKECSKLITNRYSTSFSMGIRLFHKKFRMPIYGIYGFVRFADEIVDTFHDSDKRYLLDKFKKDTYEAIEQKISLNPVLHSFQEVVNKYNIDLELIEAFLKSMEMDLDNSTYNTNLYEEYIYGSAEVVGLMCLKVFCPNDDKSYQLLKDDARSLGSAFQKINFLRDIKSDFDERGRVYFPNVDYINFTEQEKIEIEKDISIDFDNGLNGIRNLPSGAKFGVYLAYIYYVNLFNKIKSAPIEEVKVKRFRVRNRRKVYLLAKSAVKLRLNLI